MNIIEETFYLLKSYKLEIYFIIRIDRGFVGEKRFYHLWIYVRIILIIVDYGPKIIMKKGNTSLSV